MRIIYYTQSILCLLGSALLFHSDKMHQSYSYFCGSALLLLSIFLLSLGWGLIFQKKLIALAGGIIVFKYAILGIIIFTIVRLPWFNALWFSIGIASFVVSAICYAIAETRKEGNNNVI